MFNGTQYNNCNKSINTVNTKKHNKYYSKTLRRFREVTLCSELFTQIDGQLPFFSLLEVPGMGMARWKHSGKKCSEHIENSPVGKKLARWSLTKYNHFSRSFLSVGLVWIDIPGPATLLHPCTTQREDGIIFCLYFKPYLWFVLSKWFE